MTRFLQICLAALILTVAAGIAALSYHGSRALEEWGKAGSETAAAFATVNRPCGHGPCGTLADVAKTLNTVRGTFGQVEIAARHENAQLSTLDAQERQLFSDLHGAASQAQDTLSALSGTAKDLSGTAQEAQRTMRAAQPLLSDLDATVAASTRVIDSANERINDPHVTSLMQHLDSTSDHVSGITGNLEKMSAQVERKVDAPATWKSRATGAGMDIMKLGIWFFTK